MEIITKCRACNYFSITSTDEFVATMDEDFDFVVTPFAFDVDLVVRSHEFEAERVYGSPGFEIPTDGTFLRIDSVFPSAHGDRLAGGGTKGGMILVKLRPLVKDLSAARVEVSFSYTDADGNRCTGSDETEAGALLAADPALGDVFADRGVRKAVALVRYVNMFQRWARDERAAGSDADAVVASVGFETGIPPPPPVTDDIDASSSAWGVTATPLRLSPAYDEVMHAFSQWFAAEVAALGDNRLADVTDRLDKIVGLAAPPSYSP